jgi:hypothetical protein
MTTAFAPGTLPVEEVAAAEHERPSAAPGGVGAEAHDMAVRRMEQVGVVPITWFAVVGELQRDWARLETAAGLAEVLAQAGGGGIAFAWETQLLATPAPEPEPALAGSAQA